MSLLRIWICALGLLGPQGELPGSDRPGGETTHEEAFAAGSGQDAMREELERIRLESAASNPYLRTAIVDSLRERFERLPRDPDDPRRTRLGLRLGSELLRVGRTSEAIEAYRAAVERLVASRERFSREQAADAFFQLGVAYLRLGEDENCCRTSGAESCILPIRGGGLHDDESGSRAAVEWLTRSLELAEPGTARHLEARWLLNLACMTLGTHPDGVPEELRIPADAFASDEPFPRFVDVAPDVGLTARGLAGGAAVEDFDGDGLLDLLISSSDTGQSLRLYTSDGRGRFVDRTREAGLTGIYGGLNLVIADYDDDGDVDAFVLRGAWWHADGRHPDSLLRNDGAGRFTDVTFEAGLAKDPQPSQNAAFADFDNDGDLDLFVGRESDPSNRASCALFENDGEGRFTDVADRAGVRNDAYTKGCAWGDVDGDGFPDLYLSNMGGANRLLHNEGDGTFRDVTEKAGVGAPFGGFATWFFDYDQDGALDLFAASYGGARGEPPTLADVAASYLGWNHQGEPMRLYRGDGRGGFTDVSAAQGLDLFTLTMGANFGDVDNDGYPDFYLGTGYIDYQVLVPNVMYRNRRGHGFADVTTAGGFGHLQKGHGISFADLDGDGDQDVLLRAGGGFPGDAYRCVLFENPGNAASWIKIRLVGERSNRSAIGARIRIDVVEGGEERSIHRVVGTGGSFGCNPLLQEIGLGNSGRIETLQIDWPTTRTRQVFHDLEPRRSIVVHEGSDEIETVPIRSFRFGGGEGG